MRTWGRVPAGVSGLYSGAIGEMAIGLGGIGTDTTKFPEGYQWVEVATDDNGFNDAVWLTTLAQVLALGLNESPIFGSYGIPGQQSVVTQTPPDYYVALTQQNFARFFLALLVAKQSASPPTYRVNATANPGAKLLNPVPI